MKQDHTLQNFNDILEPRRLESSNFFWVSRNLNCALAYNRDVKPYSEMHKQGVIDSWRMQEIIENVCAEGHVSKAEILNQIRLILDEIGFKKQMKVIRWLGLFLTKICQKVCSGIYVNEDSINILKAQMGNCPVILAPSHRSYADFILMSYILFTYDIEIPAIAAGMDFHGMWGMGTVLRNTGAFFMRRTYNDDRTYWDTFKQYVHQLITRGDLPIEFFIEGTRSRSCKSLVPKFGLLSMMLKPFFTSEVPDVLIVPINISYDRVLEEKLFAYELLGIPKPKETTSGFFKSLSMIKEKYGNIYANFGEPISVKKYFGEQLDRSQHAIKPIHQQEITQNERKLLSSLAFDVVHEQQNHSVITAFNLIAAILSNNLMQRNKSFTTHELTEEIKWLKDAMEVFGALVSTEHETLEDALIVHENLIEIDDHTRVNLIHVPVVLNNVDPSRLKGYALSDETMTLVVPFITLQLYVNPCLHYMTNSSIIIVILSSLGRSCEFTKDELFGHFRFLRSLLSQEFVFYNKWENMDFEDSLKQLDFLHVIETVVNGKIMLGNNEKLRILLCNMLLPFLSTYHTVCHFLQNEPVGEFIEQSTILKNVQKMLENAIIKSKVFVHPYSLNLDTVGICLQNLSALNVLEQCRKNGKLKYKMKIHKLNDISEKIGQYSYCYTTAFTNAGETLYVASKL